jgi:hypothetical protein
MDKCLLFVSLSFCIYIRLLFLAAQSSVVVRYAKNTLINQNEKKYHLENE